MTIPRRLPGRRYFFLGLEVTKVAITVSDIGQFCRVTRRRAGCNLHNYNYYGRRTMVDVLWSTPNLAVLLLGARLFGRRPLRRVLAGRPLPARIQPCAGPVPASTGLQYGATCIAQGGMTLRSVPDTIRSLRLTLQELERSRDIAHDSMDFAQLKRAFFKRIAELEMEQARRNADRIDYKIAS